MLAVFEREGLFRFLQAELQLFDLAVEPQAPTVGVALAPDPARLGASPRGLDIFTDIMP